RVEELSGDALADRRRSRRPTGCHELCRVLRKNRRGHEVHATGFGIGGHAIVSGTTMRASDVNARWWGERRKRQHLLLRSRMESLTVKGAASRPIMNADDLTARCGETQGPQRL